MKAKGTLTDLKMQDKELRKNIIMDAAERVFANKPYDKVNIREIAKEAGMATSSIYTYFPNQEMLFVESAMRDTSLLIEELEAIITSAEENSIEQFTNVFIEYFVQHDAYFRMVSLFMLNGNLSSDSIEKANISSRRFLNVFDKLFIKMHYSGEVRMLSHTFFAALGGILISYRKYPGRTEEEIIRHMKHIGKNVEKMIISLIEKEERNKSWV